MNYNVLQVAVKAAWEVEPLNFSSREQLVEYACWHVIEQGCVTTFVKKPLFGLQQALERSKCSITTSILWNILLPLEPLTPFPLPYRSIYCRGCRARAARRNICSFRSLPFHHIGSKSPLLFCM